MNQRLKKLRKSLDLTQQKFADRIGVKRNTVGQWECGINPLTDQTISSICREFNVNENWLRTGKGEMFIKQTRDEQIASFVGSIQSSEDDSFKKRFISMLSSLDESEWEVLEKMVIMLHEKKD
jgi:HTH-type transcriptional regulator/antitoxin PezA